MNSEFDNELVKGNRKRCHRIWPIILLCAFSTGMHASILFQENIVNYCVYEQNDKLMFVHTLASALISIFNTDNSGTLETNWTEGLI